MAGISSVATYVPATTDRGPPAVPGPMGSMTSAPCAEHERNQPTVERVDDAGAVVPLARGASPRARGVGGDPGVPGTDDVGEPTRLGCLTLRQSLIGRRPRNRAARPDRPTVIDMEISP
jgi:hypothetical protein